MEFNAINYCILMNLILSFVSHSVSRSTGNEVGKHYLCHLNLKKIISSHFSFILIPSSGMPHRIKLKCKLFSNTFRIVQTV